MGVQTRLVPQNRHKLADAPCMPDVSLNPVTFLNISAELWVTTIIVTVITITITITVAQVSLVSSSFAENIKQSFYDGSHA